MSLTSSTFRDLFDIDDFIGVEIPIIQRDYAQGRVTASDVRDQFVDALHEALMLPPDSPQLPLDLDFVYGSLDESDLGTVFSPLDGQQRLTALFLLHWYLAVHDKRLAEFQAFMCDGKQSRFSYKVRASSDDFFDTLANADFELPDDGDDPISGKGVITQAIEDQPWFFLAWRQDPTVSSALRVLDTIHERFKDTSGLYDRLVDRDAPVITFQFLNLHDFGLSDELYIKMNARGKALTEFEAFKARLGQKINSLLEGQTYSLETREMLAQEYFGHRVDSTWADVFWHYRDKESRTFDRQFMNFVRGLVSVTFPYAMRNADSKHVNMVMRTLSEHGEHYNYYRYDKDACLTADFAEMLISVLDQLSSNGQELQTFLPNGDYYDERDVFDRILRRERPGASKSVLQSEWVQFYGYCVYLHAYRPAPGDERFAEWMRIVSNLALNTIINRADDFIRALTGVRALLQNLGDTPVLEYISEQDVSNSVLNRQQWREECLKAQLMLKHLEWREVLAIAERHRYFRGQIEFLLDFSGVLQRWLDNTACDWSEDEDTAYREAFKMQFEKANAVFGDEGLRKFDDFVWERALLTFGDYLLPSGRNLSLLDNRDRTASWKRLLRGDDNADDPLLAKREFVRTALDSVNPESVQKSLKSLIDQRLEEKKPEKTPSWQRLLVECPVAIDYCRQRFIRITDNDGIYLLAKKRTSSLHAELRSYHLAHAVLPAMLDRGELSAFDDVGYEKVSGESEQPYVYLLSDTYGLCLSIWYQTDKFYLDIEPTGESDVSIGDDCWIDLGLFHCTEHEGTVGKSVDLAEIESVVRDISDRLLFLSEEDGK